MGQTCNKTYDTDTNPRTELELWCCDNIDFLESVSLNRANLQGPENSM